MRAEQEPEPRGWLLWDFFRADSKSSRSPPIWKSLFENDTSGACERTPKHLDFHLYTCSLVVKQRSEPTGSQADWVKRFLLEMIVGHCSYPQDLSAVAAPDAPEKQKQILKHLNSTYILYFCIRCLQMLKYLVPVGWNWLWLYNSLYPLQVDCDESL